MTTKTKKRPMPADAKFDSCWINDEGCACVKFHRIAKVFAVKQLLGEGDQNTKTRKNSLLGYLTKSLSLSPSTESGVGNTCPKASRGCADACLDHQGLASVFTAIRLARRAKTIAFYKQRDWFLDQLARELTNAVSWADRKDQALAVRLNMFSDLPFESFHIVSQFPNIHFYDYTKIPRRAGALADNYWVTFSRSETNHEDCLRVLRSGNNVAIAFADMSRETGFVGNRSKYQSLPKRWNGFTVINGDETDLRFLDKRGVVVGLKLKANSNAERQGAIDSGFAVQHKGGK